MNASILETLLKGFGLDPAELANMAKSAKENIESELVKIRLSIESIEASQEKIMARLEAQNKREGLW